MTLLKLIFSKSGEAKNLKGRKETRVKKSSFHSILKSELRSSNPDLDAYLLRRKLSSFIGSSKLLDRLGERRLKVLVEFPSFNSLKLKEIYREKKFSECKFQSSVFRSVPLSKETGDSLKVSSKSKSQVVCVNDSQFLGLSYLTPTFNPTLVNGFYQKTNNCFCSSIISSVNPRLKFRKTSITLPYYKDFKQKRLKTRNVVSYSNLRLKKLEPVNGNVVEKQIPFALEFQKEEKIDSCHTKVLCKLQSKILIKKTLKDVNYFADFKNKIEEKPLKDIIDSKRKEKINSPLIRLLKGNSPLKRKVKDIEAFRLKANANLASLVSSKISDKTIFKLPFKFSKGAFVSKEVSLYYPMFNFYTDVKWKENVRLSFSKRKRDFFKPLKIKRERTHQGRNIAVEEKRDKIDRTFLFDNLMKVKSRNVNYLFSFLNLDKFNKRERFSTNTSIDNFGFDKLTSMYPTSFNATSYIEQFNNGSAHTFLKSFPYYFLADFKRAVNRNFALTLKDKDLALRLSLREGKVLNLSLSLFGDSRISTVDFLSEITSLIRSNGFVPGKVYVKLKGKGSVEKRDRLELKV